MFPCADAAPEMPSTVPDAIRPSRRVKSVFGSSAPTAPPASAAATEPGCPGDLNWDGVVDVDDLLILLANWGPCDCDSFPLDT